jgi:hypothetical protein
MRRNGRNKVKEVEDNNFKLRYTSTHATKNEVGIMIDKNLKDGMMTSSGKGT